MRDLRANPIGIYEKAIPNAFTWEKKIDAAKKAGFDFIEISIDETDERLSRLNWSREEKEHLRNLLWKKDFYIRSMCLSGHRKYPFGSRDPEKRKRSYEIMDKALEFAKELNIRNIQLAGYDVYYEESDEDTRRGFLQGLKYSVERATKENIMLSIEIMDTEFLGTISRCMSYINIIDSPWLNIYTDLGNLTQWCADPQVELKKGNKRMVAIHLKDTKPGVFKCIPFGEGTVEFDKLFYTLKEIDYCGPFLVEMWADNNKEKSEPEVVDEIKRAREWLQDRM